MKTMNKSWQETKSASHHEMLVSSILAVCIFESVILLLYSYIL